MSGHLGAGILTVATEAASLLSITGGVMVTVWYRAHHGHRNRSNNQAKQHPPGNPESGDVGEQWHVCLVDLT